MEAKTFGLIKFIGYSSAKDIGKMPYKDIQLAIKLYNEYQEKRKKQKDEENRKIEQERLRSKRQYKQKSKPNFKKGNFKF